MTQPRRRAGSLRGARDWAAGVWLDKDADLEPLEVYPGRQARTSRKALSRCNWEGAETKPAGGGQRAQAGSQPSRMGLGSVQGDADPDLSATYAE